MLIYTTKRKKKNPQTNPHSALLTTLGLRAAPGQVAANHASALLVVNWFFAYILTSPRGAKIRLGLDHNVNPREDLTTYGEAAVQSGKITRRALDQLKRQTSAHANVQEGFTLFVAASMWKSFLLIGFMMNLHFVKLLHCTDLTI